MTQYGLDSYWEWVVPAQEQFDPVEGRPNIWLEKVAAKTLQASRMNLWTEIWKPFPACPWCLWLLKNQSPWALHPSEITGPHVWMPWEFSSLLTQLVSTSQLSSRNHTAIGTNIPESQHSSCLSLHPSQLRAWAEVFQPYLHINLHTKFQQESKLYPNEPIWLEDMGRVPEILFCRLPQSHGSLALCREDKLLHFPIQSRKCIHRRCPRGRSYEESRAQLPVMKETFCSWRLGVGSTRNG